MQDTGTPNLSLSYIMIRALLSSLETKVISLLSPPTSKDVGVFRKTICIARQNSDKYTYKDLKIHDEQRDVLTKMRGLTCMYMYTPTILLIVFILYRGLYIMLDK